MKLQPRSLIPARGIGRKGQSTLPVRSDPEQATAPHLQNLAAELHQSAVKGLFEYSSTVMNGVRGLAVVLILSSLAHVLMTAIPTLQSVEPLSRLLVDWSFWGAAAGVVVAGAVSALLLNIFTPIQVTPGGLGVAEITGWRRIPWQQVGVLRVMELPARGRYVVMVPFTGSSKPGTPAPMLRLLPALAGGALYGRGVTFTSDIKNFDRLLQLIVSYMAQVSGQQTPALEAMVDEDTVMPIAQLLFEPEAALTRLSRHSRATADFYGVQAVDDSPPLNWRRILSRQLAIALAPTVLVLLDLMTNSPHNPFSLGHLVWVLALLALGVAELPFIASLIQGVGELMLGSGQFKRAVLAYQELQTPRALLVLLGAAIVSTGFLVPLALALWLAGIVITMLLTTRFVRKLYFVPLLPALLASAGTLIFQVSILALYFGIR